MKFSRNYVKSTAGQIKLIQVIFSLAQFGSLLSAEFDGSFCRRVRRKLDMEPPTSSPFIDHDERLFQSHLWYQLFTALSLIGFLWAFNVFAMRVLSSEECFRFLHWEALDSFVSFNVSTLLLITASIVLSSNCYCFQCYQEIRPPYDLTLFANFSANLGIPIAAILAYMSTILQVGWLVRAYWRSASQPNQTKRPSDGRTSHVYETLPKSQDNNGRAVPNTYGSGEAKKTVPEEANRRDDQGSGVRKGDPDGMADGKKSGPKAEKVGEDEKIGGASDAEQMDVRLDAGDEAVYMNTVYTCKVDI